MLSAVLQSPRAVAVSIEIIRVFVHMRQLLASHADLRGKLESMRHKYDHQFAIVFDVLRELTADERRRIIDELPARRAALPRTGTTSPEE